MPVGPVGIDYRKRNDNAASPRRHFVNVDRNPIREKHQFRRNGGNDSPIDGTDHCEVEPYVGICSFDTAQSDGFFFCAHDMRCVNGIASQPKRQVCFYGGIQLGWPSFENVPTAVRKLLSTDVICEFSYLGGIELAEYMQVDNVVGYESGISFELTPPISFLGLCR